MSNKKKATWKDLVQVQAEEVTRLTEKDKQKSLLDEMTGRYAASADALFDSQMTHAIRLNQQLDELYGMRGHHSACEACPLSLACLAGRPPGTWCAQCMSFYNKELNVHVCCDAVKSYVGFGGLGGCPTCDNGQPKDTLVGVQFLTVGEAELLFSSNGHTLGLVRAAEDATSCILKSMTSTGMARQILKAQLIEDEEGDDD